MVQNRAFGHSCAIMECRVNWNSAKGWYWEGLAGHEVLARGIAETEEDA
jgi:hypothetical protein